jgi:cytidylate kinase
MEHKTSIGLFRKYFERQLEQARKTLEKSEKYNQPFITISRLTGAGGVNFPENLINHLNNKERSNDNNWMYFDKNILEIVLEEHNLPKEISRFMPEAKISGFQDVLEQSFGLHPSEFKLLTKISETIIHLSHLGNVVLVGRGSNIITSKNKNGIHLRLIDSLEKRIENIQKYFKISRIEAINLIQKEDDGRANYVKKYFSKDINNQSLYTLVINFDLMKSEDAIELICDETIKIRKRING